MQLRGPAHRHDGLWGGVWAPELPMSTPPSAAAHDFGWMRLHCLLTASASRLVYSAQRTSVPVAGGVCTPSA